LTKLLWFSVTKEEEEEEEEENIPCLSGIVL
jgi:hypothetical protein